MTDDYRDLARRLRVHALRMVARADASHIGSCLSMADLLAVLFGGVLKLDPASPDWPERDRFLLSKGHGAAILYAALAERGFFPIADLERYAQDGSPMTGHASHCVSGVEFATGSLGHALPIGGGMALAAKRAGLPWRTYVLLSDGELDEGSNWEAALFAGHHRLDNLIAIMDFNKIQSFGRVKDVLDLDPLPAKWSAFGWAVREVDGHDVDAIAAALTTVPWQADQPSVLIAHTIKGKGVSFMEDQLAWHYSSPKPEQLAQALREIEAGG